MAPNRIAYAVVRETRHKHCITVNIMADDDGKFLVFGEKLRCLRWMKLNYPEYRHNKRVVHEGDDRIYVAEIPLK